MSWSTRFSDPIALPDGGKLTTLQDAGSYITKLPKEMQATKEWQNATHVLIQAADHDGPIEFARLGMMHALWPKGTPVYHSVDTIDRLIDVLDDRDFVATLDRINRRRVIRLVE